MSVETQARRFKFFLNLLYSFDSLCVCSLPANLQQLSIPAAVASQDFRGRSSRGAFSQSSVFTSCFRRDEEERLLVFKSTYGFISAHILLIERPVS